MSRLTAWLRRRGYLEAKGGRLTVYVGNSTILSAISSGERIYLEAQDVSLTPHIASHGYWEPAITHLLRQYIRPGGHFVDVGANCGYYALIAATLVGPEGRVAAIDANPRMCALMTKSAAVNGYDHRLSVHNFAVGRDEAMLTLNVPGDFFGSAYIGEERAEGAGLKIQARCRRLDDILGDAGIDRVDVLKVDAEGSEYSIWQGAGKTLANRDIVIFTEFAPPMLSGNADALLQRMKADGFTIYAIESSGQVVETDSATLLTKEHSDLLLKRS